MGLRQLVATKGIPRMLLPATKCIHRMQIMKRKPANAYLQDGVNVAPAELPDAHVQDESGTACRDNCTTALSSQSTCRCLPRLCLFSTNMYLHVSIYKSMYVYIYITFVKGSD